MIIIRNIFQIRAGSMKQAVEVAKQGRQMTLDAGFKNARLLTDVVSDFYTLVLETEVESLAAFEERIGKNFQDPKWQEWYKQFTPLIQSGRREIFTIVD